MVRHYDRNFGNPLRPFSGIMTEADSQYHFVCNFTYVFLFFWLTSTEYYMESVCINRASCFFVVGRISAGNIFIYFEYYKLLISPYMNSNLYFTLCHFGIIRKIVVYF